MPVIDKEWARYRDEERKALQRIGDGPTSTIEWLLRFVQTDLENLSEGQWSDLLVEVSAFARGHVPFKSTAGLAKDISSSYSRWETSIRIGNKRRSQGKVVKKALIPSRETVKELHLEMKTAMDHCFEHSHEVYLPSIELSLTVSDARFSENGLSQAEAKKRAVLIVHAAKLEHTFYYYASLLLTEYLPRIKHCTVCQKLYVAIRSDRYFCSARCLNRATQQRFRDRKKKR